MKYEKPQLILLGENGSTFGGPGDCQSTGNTASDDCGGFGGAAVDDCKNGTHAGNPCGTGTTATNCSPTGSHP